MEETSNWFTEHVLSEDQVKNLIAQKIERAKLYLTAAQELVNRFE